MRFAGQMYIVVSVMLLITVMDSPVSFRDVPIASYSGFVVRKRLLASCSFCGGNATTQNSIGKRLLSENGLTLGLAELRQIAHTILPPMILPFLEKWARYCMT